ncbi:MAG TPA: hemerythrin domain-containing protein [Acidimicrobiales bacterium]|jgi:hemerythrin superfamily protein|nr:hemerythrin domain-containing protein [Acidimicrobiales bacterium]
MDAITLLKQDHKTVEAIFKQFEKATQPAQQRNLARRVIEELSVHAAIEEMIFYPAVRERVPTTQETVLESLEEHHIVKWTLSELEDLKPDDERFKAKMTVLIESVRHHVKEEEQELFPEVRKAIGRKDMAELGDALEQAKKTAPTRPHPKAPDTPPGNLVAGPAAAVVDKVKQKVAGKK